MTNNQIDWETAEKIIKQSITMTDNEVDEVLNSLIQAKKMYGTLDEFPERIQLTDKKGYPRHTIVTHGGNFDTVIVNPVSSAHTLIILGGIIMTVVIATLADVVMHRYFS